jgi:tetratricopeptide (TPR) repeat protein
MMSKKVILGVTLILGLILILGCIPKEIRTVKIELGPWNHPKANPDIERVKANLKLAEQAYPNDPEVYHLWGRIYALEDNYVEMDKAFAKCDSMSDSYTAVNDTIRMTEWDVLWNKALDEYKNADYEGTLTNLKNAIICWPGQYEPYLYGADAAYRLGNTEEAYQLSKKGYELVPDTANMARQYGEMCLMNDKLDEAKTVFLKLVEKDPTNANYMFNLGEIFLAEGDTTKALEYYEGGLKIEPDNADGFLSISRLYFVMKNYPKCIEAFEHYKALATPSKDDYFLYLLALYQNNDFAKAQTELEAFTMEHPDYCDAWQLLANSYIRQGMQKEAKKATTSYDDCVKK